jgi:hypothetical protein
MRSCAIRKCKYSEIFELSCCATSEKGRVRVILMDQPFCFWHYYQVQLNKLRVRDFKEWRGTTYTDLVMTVLR